MAQGSRGWRGALLGLGLAGTALMGTAVGAAEPACGLDVDGNGEAAALADGLLVLRHLSGYSGTALTAGAVGAGCTRCSAAQIGAFLRQADCVRMLDVDGNGQRAAQTDGRLFVRYLLGFTGQALIEDAVATDAHTDANSIQIQLAYYGSARTETLAETLAPGAQATSDSGLATLENTGTASVPVQVIEGTDADGNPVLEIQVGGAGIELTLPDPSQMPALKPQRASPVTPARAAMQSYAISKTWQSGSGWFSRINSLIGAYNRLPNGANTLPYVATAITIVRLPTYELDSVCALSDASCYSGKESVLFVHGFNLWSNFGGLGGGEGTWADFPRLLQSAAAVVPFEFRWNSAARFQDAAREPR